MSICHQYLPRCEVSVHPNADGNVILRRPLPRCGLSCCCLSVTLARVVAGFYSKPTAGGLLPPLPQDSGARP
jgi:hypothetical protein